MKKFRKVAVGGTFDEFHRGHKVLLLEAFDIGKHVLIGLCSDEFVEKMGKPHATASYEERLKELRVFLKTLGQGDAAEIVPDSMNWTHPDGRNTVIAYAGFAR